MSANENRPGHAARTVNEKQGRLVPLFSLANGADKGRHRPPLACRAVGSGRHD